jgi:MFS transporter, OCT family, solute carrier family 22 (organic cation transporter), member 16
MLVAGWAALIHDRLWLQVVYGLHGLLLITHWWTMDESPRWLWMQGRHSEAVNIVAGGVKTNGRGIKLDKEYFLTKAKASKKVVETKVETAGIADLFKTPNLRKMTLNVCLCWFANSIVYYGLSLGSGELEGNPFVNLCLVGLVEMPSYIATILLMDRLGRRFLTSFLMLAGGFCCIIAAFIAGKNT